MHDLDEQMNMLNKRINEIKQKKKTRRRKIAGIVSAMAGIALIICLGIAMPPIMNNFTNNQYLVAGMLGSMFSNGSAIGYVVIGIFAFVLGTFVTILCTHIHNLNKKDEYDDGNI